jgi:signal transduction histidine kinase
MSPAPAPGPLGFPRDEVEKVLPGGGELGALMRAKDWSATPLGPVASWPQSLRTAVGMMLASPPASFIFWGRELSMLYNDAGLPILGGKHPEDLGQSIKIALKEAWSVLGPLVESVLDTGTAVYLEDLLIPLARFGFVQDGYYTFSYLPIRDEAGGVGGIFVIVMETTGQVVGARRLALIRELSIRSALCQSVASVLRAVDDVLGQAPSEVPFALLYEVRGERAHLVVSAGIARGLAASPVEIPVQDGGTWPLAEVVRSRRDLLVEGLARFGVLPGGPSGEPATRALLLPLAAEGEGQATFVLVVGLNPRIPLDGEARSFLQLLARQIATSIAGTRALEEKTQRAAQLAELDRQKTQFFSNVSHEFRTPLTLILGPTEDALASPARALSGEQLERVHGNAQRLLKLVNTLLEFSRVEAGKSRAVFQPVDLAAQTAGLANAFESVIVHAGLGFVVDCPPLPEPVWVDPSLWEKVVLNLVSNAFKFTLAGQITVRQRWTGQGVELTVADTGIGIAPGELPTIFQRFRRIEGARGRSHEGSGIGLSLVEALVKLHGGEVRAESAPGAGSTFTVTLLAGNAHLPAQDLQPVERAAATASAAPAFVREAAHWLPAPPGEVMTPELDGPASSLREAPASAPPAEARARVLFADDNADMREYVRRILAEHFVVEAVADGKAALDAARERPPDLVLSDVMMPVLDGLALTRALRGEPRTRHVPIILLSARAGESATVEGLRAGADDYLVKPFGARELVARVEGAVRVARAEVERRRALERVSEVLEATTDGFFTLDSAWRITGGNASYERMTQTLRDEVLGRVLWEVFPGTADPASRYWQDYHRCMNERVDVQFVDYYAPLDLWTEVRANPTPDGGIAVWFRDVATEVRAKALLVRQAEFEKQLIGIVSHDLRNPLNVILLASELLRELDGLGDDGTRTVGRIQSAAESAIHLVRDLLDFTQARLGGGIHVKPRSADWHALVRAVLEDEGASASFPGRRFEVLQEGDGEGEWDPDRFAQVAQNLVSNALKYSPQGSLIRVHTRVVPEEATLVVNNAGAPIPPEKLPILFEPLQRAAGQMDVASHSVGLGLYIVKQIVEAHRGSVEVQSTEAGGTTFTVRLPRVVAPHA